MPLSDNARGALYMSVAMTAFTANDACMKAVTQVLPLYQAMFLRGALATLALLAIGWHMGSLRFGMEASDRKWLVLRTLGEVGGTLTFLSALRHMPLANLSAILQFLPLAVTLAAALLLRSRSAGGGSRPSSSASPASSLSCVPARKDSTAGRSSAWHPWALSCCAT